MARHLAKLVSPRILLAGLITVALTILFSLSSSSTHADGSFDTTTEYFLCNHLPSGFNGPAPLPGFSDCGVEFGPDAAISGTATTLTDTRRTGGSPLPKFSSPDDGLTGHTVEIAAGACSGQVRTIVSNDEDTLTIAAWTACTPDDTTVYVVDPGDFSPDANPDWGFHWDVPSGDYNFSTFAFFMSDGFSIAADAAIDDGTAVGGIEVQVTMGLLSGFCGNPIPVDFILFDSTTNTSPSNTVDAGDEGTPDRFLSLTNDDGDTFYGQADADSPAVLQYPSFLNTLLDPDLDYPGGFNGPLDPISPWARYTGLTQVPPGSEWIFLTILVFEKTQLAPFVNDPHNATHPFARYGRNPDEAGWVHIVILQDPTELVASTSNISDFCTPLVADAMFLGQVTDTTHGTVNRLTSPAAGTGIDDEGTHLLLLYGMSIRDADGDGLENSFDTCPFAANVDDPRATTGADVDMIDPVCDPGPLVPENGFDFDGDGFLNPQDNCPLAANVSQAQGEESTTYVLAAPDGGFKDDSIGDACDSEFGLGNGIDDDIDGRIDEDPANGVDDDFDLAFDEDGASAVGNTPDESGLPLGSDAVADGAFLDDMSTEAVCIATNSAASDPDGDGWCGASPGADPAPNNPNVTGAPSIDTDSDGFPNDSELLIGTDPLVDCPLVLGTHDAWPADFTGNRFIALDDLFNVLPPTFGSSPGIPDTNGDGIQDWRPRADLMPNGFINLEDVFLVLPPTFGTNCTP